MNTINTIRTIEQVVTLCPHKYKYEVFTLFQLALLLSKEIDILNQVPSCISSLSAILYKGMIFPFQKDFYSGLDDDLLLALESHRISVSAGLQG